MSRGQGKHTPRKPVVSEIDPDSPEGRQLGMSRRTQGIPSPIPGGRNHISNAPVIRQEVPITTPGPEIVDQNAHGVPHGSATTRERAEVERGPNSVHQDAPQHHGRTEQPAPIPVRIVEDHNGASFRTSAPHHITVPVQGGDPVRLCGRDTSRTSVMLLNEGAAATSNIRFAQRLSDLNMGGGAMLPAASTSYLRMHTQDELWGISNDGTAQTVSIIQEFEQYW